MNLPTLENEKKSKLYSRKVTFCENDENNTIDEMNQNRDIQVFNSYCL